MATFADLTAKLNLNFSNFASGMQKASATANAFAANLEGKINTGMVEPAKKAKFEFKDVARIVQGILISKAFYSGLNSIRSATNAVWEFSKELEYAQMVYSNLFGDSSLATEFINVLKDFSAVTPFTLSDSEAAAKRLLAYGIQYKNVMYVMRGVLAAATVQGNSAIIEPISRAIGQIYTKGRLMNEEMRQLAEAGIPAYEILQEKLGLTADQLRNLGREAIPASAAINALIEGINERFGTTLDMANQTMQGIISNIKDNALQLFSSMFGPMYDNVKTALGAFASFLFKIKEIQDTLGTGGVFEALVPAAIQDDVRTLIANLSNLWNIIKTIASAVGSLFGPLLTSLMQVLNLVLPIFNVILGVFAGIISAIAKNAGLMKVLIALILGAAAAWVIFKMRAIAAAVATAVIWGIINAVKGLILALNFLCAHPVWALLAFGVGLIVALTGASSGFSKAVKGITSSLTGLGGADTSKILLPDSKERASDLSKFNNALDGTSDSMDNLTDSTGAATKAAKGLLGFDEVFSLKAPDEGSGSGIGDALDGLGGGGGFDMPELELPDFGGFANNFTEGLLSALGGKKAVISAGIGALIGAAIGAIIGGPIGAKIGAVIGGLAGWLWAKLAEKLGMSDAQTIALPIGTLIGAAIGYCVAGPLGALIGGAIGALVGYIVSVFIDEWDKIKENLKDSIGSAIGMLIGAIVGTLIAGPIGTALGALIGYVVGALIQLLVKNWGKVTDWISAQWTAWLDRMKGNWFSAIIGLVGGIIGMLCAGPLGALLGALAGFIIGTLVDLIVNNWTKITDWFSQAIKDIEIFFKTIILAATFAWDALKTSVSKWLSTAWTNVSAWLTTTYNNIKTWFSNLPGSVGTWLGSVWTKVSGWFSTTATNIGTWFSNQAKSIATWGTNLITNIGKFFVNLWSGIWKSISDIGTKIGTWWDNLWKNKSATVTVNGKQTTTTVPQTYHAKGGVFNREHVANFAEGNKAEAIIPLENASAMQPFVDAVSNGLSATLLPIVAKLSGNNTGSLQPLYVGTLIGDERSLKELSKRMNIIQLEEEARKGG